jgi:hypothetical protein
MSQRSPDGYTYEGNNYCPDCIIHAISGINGIEIGHVYDVEAVLDIIAGVLEIDRKDENTFDSNEFPKVIFNTDEEERCANYNKCFGRI